MRATYPQQVGQSQIATRYNGVGPFYPTGSALVRAEATQRLRVDVMYAKASGITAAVLNSPGYGILVSLDSSAITASTDKVATIVAADPNIALGAAHGFVKGDTIVFWDAAAATLPPEIVAGRIYIVVDSQATTVQIGYQNSIAIVPSASSTGVIHANKVAVKTFRFNVEDVAQTALFPLSNSLQITLTGASGAASVQVVDTHISAL